MKTRYKPSRKTATIEGDFVVFLIGMRIKRPLAVHRWLPIIGAMGEMIIELRREPGSGLLGIESAFGRTILMVQYWRSMDDLIAYANDPARKHRPAWQAFYKDADGSVGFWHEAYAVRSGEYEAVYVDMPEFGLGRAGSLQPATGKMTGAEARLRANGGTA